MSDKTNQTAQDVMDKCEALNNCGVNEIHKHIKYHNGNLNIQFQVGHPGGEGSIDGCFLTHGIQVLIKKAEHYNKACPSRENSLVITKLQEALMWAEERTRDRERRGVSQTDQK